MVNDVHDIPEDVEKTQPPMSALRHETPVALYAAMPMVKKMTQHRPREEESNLDFLERLSNSATPEEALTVSAFAAVPAMAIWWGYECLRLASDDMNQSDRELMELVAHWCSQSDDEHRFRVMSRALYAPKRTPAVYLGLAVGWSGGAFAPNDQAPVAPQRAPRAVNSAVLSSLARAELTQRPVRLARFIDQASALFRPF
jgi:hypothetical protein